MIARKKIRKVEITYPSTGIKEDFYLVTTTKSWKLIPVWMTKIKLTPEIK